MATSPETSRSLARYVVVLTAFTAVGLIILWRVSDALLLIFAGILFGAFLDAAARLLGEVMPWGRGVRLGIVCAILGIILLAAIVWGGTLIVTQGSQLAATLREQANHVLEWLRQYGIDLPPSNADGSAAAGQGTDAAHLRGAVPTLQSMMPNVGGLFGPAWAAVSLVLGVLGDALVVVFLGIFLAMQPIMYRDALLLIVPPKHRPRYREVLDESGETLRNWLLGQALTMSVIFACVWLGLTLVGVGPAFLLGLQAGLLAFVPTLGPFLAGIAIMLASLASGLWGVIGALGVYLTVQTLESYFLTPMIQRRAISVPPAFLFASQITLGLLFGIYGLALATPLAAIGRVFIRRLYVEDALGDQVAEDDAPPTRIASRASAVS
jgi:predicted PurR-regulated permease PerM